MTTDHPLLRNKRSRAPRQMTSSSVAFPSATVMRTATGHRENVNCPCHARYRAMTTEQAAVKPLNSNSVAQCVLGRHCAIVRLLTWTKPPRSTDVLATPTMVSAGRICQGHPRRPADTPPALAHRIIHCAEVTSVRVATMASRQTTKALIETAHSGTRARQRAAAKINAASRLTQPGDAFTNRGSWFHPRCFDASR